MLNCMDIYMFNEHVFFIFCYLYDTDIYSDDLSSAFVDMLLYLSHKLLYISYTVYQHKLAAARHKKGTAQSLRLANLRRIFINLSWYDSV